MRRKLFNLAAISLTMLCVLNCTGCASADDAKPALCGSSRYQARVKTFKLSPVEAYWIAAAEFNRRTGLDAQCLSVGSAPFGLADGCHVSARKVRQKPDRTGHPVNVAPGAVKPRRIAARSAAPPQPPASPLP